MDRQCLTKKGGMREREIAVGSLKKDRGWQLGMACARLCTAVRDVPVHEVELHSTRHGERGEERRDRERGVDAHRTCLSGALAD